MQSIAQRAQKLLDKIETMIQREAATSVALVTAELDGSMAEHAVDSVSNQPLVQSPAVDEGLAMILENSEPVKVSKTPKQIVPSSQTQSSSQSWRSEVLHSHSANPISSPVQAPPLEEKGLQKNLVASPASQSQSPVCDTDSDDDDLAFFT